MQTAESQSTNWEAVESLGKIAQGNQEAIQALIEEVQNGKDHYTRWLDWARLEEIAKDNPGVIELAQSSQVQYRLQAIESLGKIAKNNPEAIQALTRLVQSAEDEYTPRLAVVSLGEIGKDNPEVIQTLIQLVQTVEDNCTCGLAVLSIGEIEDDETRRQAIDRLKKIDKNNSKALQALIELVPDDLLDKYTRRRGAYSLGRIARDDTEALHALIKLVQSSIGYFDRLRVVDSLTQFIEGDRLGLVVLGLKSSLEEQVYENDPERFKACCNVIWHCAQNLTYSAFYQAWHQQEEVDNTTTPNTQNLNQANLPQSLQNAIANGSPF